MNTETWVYDKEFAILAARFAGGAHLYQKRKYTGEPYFLHCHEVATIIKEHYPKDYEVIAAAYLHDVVEDCGIRYNTLVSVFGVRTAAMVSALSDVEIGNRVERKRLSRIRLHKACKEVQDIKCADIISNAPSIIQHDPKFAKVFVSEVKDLLLVLDKADRELHNRACISIEPEQSSSEIFFRTSD